jgi:hypothetical protein
VARFRSRIVWGLTLAGVAVTVGISLLVAESGVSPSLSVANEPQRGRLPGPRIRVEVLNAGGVDGLARDATEYLREAGFDVVDYRNARDVGADSSLVLDRVGQEETARAVADALGIYNLRSQPDANLYVEVSVLLGSEWHRPDPPEAEREQPAWWDPRGWLSR